MKNLFRLFSLLQLVSILYSCGMVRDKRNKAFTNQTKSVNERKAIITGSITDPY